VVVIKLVALASSTDMATVDPAAETSTDTSNDISAIWKAAMDRYEEETKIKIYSLDRARNVNDILTHIQEREKKFRAHRHDESRTDKFRTLVSKSLGLIDAIGNLVAGAASMVRRKPLPAY